MTATMGRTIESMAKPVPIVGKTTTMAAQDAMAFYTTSYIPLPSYERRYMVPRYSPEEQERIYAAESARRQRERDHAARLVYDLRLTPEKKLMWQDGNYEMHTAECLFLENVTFHEGSSSLCGKTPTGGYIRATMSQDVVGFMRKGFPVQKGRYNASYGWNVQRAGRAYIEGKNILFD